jgi:biopolymer transport protein ExbD
MKLDRFRRTPEPPGLSLTAMVDVLFLMIIFLVLGANFEQLETVNLPEAHGRASEGRIVLSLELRRDGALLLQGRPLSREDAPATVRRRNPAEILILPDKAARVEDLFFWYDLLLQTLDVPVRIGVRPPSS